MKILVIKQTSLGDVLHASGHIRSIKQAYPDSRLYLLTATTSADIYRHNPWIDELILFDRYLIKHHWFNRPAASYRHFMNVMSQVREHQFDLAIDLQGLAKSVVFLYFAHAAKKYVKGNWWGLEGFRNKELHAIREMDGVLRKAKIETTDTAMEFNTGQAEKETVDTLLEEINPTEKPVIIFSAFSRWQSKDWPLESFVSLAQEIAEKVQVVFTGAADRRQDIENELSRQNCDHVVNLAGKLSLVEFAELCGRAKLMLTGDSFPMHVAGAKQTPVVALFGPTDEKKVGPLGAKDIVIRAPGCDRCDRANCPRYCLRGLDKSQVRDSVSRLLLETL